VYIGEAAQESGDDVRQNAFRKTGRGYEPQPADAESRDVIDEVADVIDVAESKLGFLEEQQRVGGRSQATAIAMEQREADAALEMSQKPAGGRLRQAEFASCGRNGARPDDGCERAQGA
jgi:hypothetical protein